MKTSYLLTTDLKNIFRKKVTKNTSGKKSFQNTEYTFTSMNTICAIRTDLTTNTNAIMRAIWIRNTPVFLVYVYCNTPAVNPLTWH